MLKTEPGLLPNPMGAKEKYLERTQDHGVRKQGRDVHSYPPPEQGVEIAGLGVRGQSPGVQPGQRGSHGIHPGALGRQGQGSERRFQLVGDVGKVLDKPVPSPHGCLSGEGKLGDGFLDFIGQTGVAALGHAVPGEQRQGLAGAGSFQQPDQLLPLPVGDPAGKGKDPAQQGEP